jgi:hypothetical protein
MVKHAQTDAVVGRIIRDGDFDAILTKIYVKDPETNITIEHRLGRVPRQIQIVWKDEYCDFKVAKDSKGQPMADSEKVTLNFFATNVTLTLRMA